MDITSIPATAYVAFGVITAALLGGLFSFANMVSSKENKVSEFRLSWADGLRNEIAEYISAAQELVRVTHTFDPEDFHTLHEKNELQIEWYKETRAAFSRAVENLTKIQLRLNADHIAPDANTPEAELMKAVMNARNNSINGDPEAVLSSCNDIRTKAAPILKSTWILVKGGETDYRRIRKYSFLTVVIGFYTIISFGIYIGAKTYYKQTDTEIRQPNPSIEEQQEKNQSALPESQKNSFKPEPNQSKTNINS